MKATIFLIESGACSRGGAAVRLAARLGTRPAAASWRLMSSKESSSSPDVPPSPPDVPPSHGSFIRRHLGPLGSGGESHQVEEMLKAVGERSIDSLMQAVIPHQVRSDVPLPSLSKMPPPSEEKMLQELRKISETNSVQETFIGQGYSDTVMPLPIKRHLLENPSWYTAYTPYQSEISQGRLEALWLYQRAICDLTGLDVANASLLDEASAAFEGILLLWRATGSKPGKSRVLVSDASHPQVLDVIRWRSEAIGISAEFLPFEEMISHASEEDVFGAFVQTPDTQGTFRDTSALAKKLHETGKQLVVSADPLSLFISRSPAEMGADVAVGTTQRFGSPLGFGGPHAGFISCTLGNAKRMPGRIVGLSKDKRGRECYRLSLQTREQHIRREKATSNICTAQALLASLNAMFLVHHGNDGMAHMARRVHGLASGFAELVKQNFPEAKISPNFFDTISIHHLKAEKIVSLAETEGMNLRKGEEKDHFLVAFDETKNFESVSRLLGVMAEATGRDLSVPPDPQVCASRDLPEVWRRLADSPPLTQKIFNSTDATNEAELTRMLRRLGAKDLGLDTSMIPLGSCTMKLNAVATLESLTLPGFSKIHPFAPQHQTKGYIELISGLERMLAEVCGMDVCSLQPNSGATGELAGLLAIRSFHDSRGARNRDLCLIPKSAHGTNSASAVLAGLRVVSLNCDKKGNIDLNHLRSIIEKQGERIAAAMVTFPSTHGNFDPNIREVADLIHGAGGQLYLDGANLNAMLTYTTPGAVGADVCHVNLHKTFAIPHGGGGPGVGPICARQHLAPFLPSHRNLKGAGGGDGGAIRAVAGAPFGSASVLTVPWSFFRLMGPMGLRRATEGAILGANYMMSRLRGHYQMKHANRINRDIEESAGGAAGALRCAHEFIIDASTFREIGITEEDIAKRLMDYGFHAPTISWPVSGSLMIEPTESETKGELDRYCDALVAIRGEIQKVANGEWPRGNNPLNNAPHTIDDLIDEEWDKPYSRIVACYPAPWTKMRGKFWPAVNRIDDAFGDAQMLCMCSGNSSNVGEEQ